MCDHHATMRVLVAEWVQSLEGLSAQELWPQRDRGWLGTGIEADFATALTYGLKPFHARAEFRPADDAYSFEAPHPDLYSAMCLQLFNLIVEDLPVRTCANETCGRRFVRQVGARCTVSTAPKASCTAAPNALVHRSSASTAAASGRRREARGEGSNGTPRCGLALRRGHRRRPGHG
jgi:hypothetical protein